MNFAIRKWGVSAIILFLCIPCIIPSYGQDVREATSLPASEGDILYVGGSGSGNYTRIQDAINASNTGDTVYVYNDSSPYYEHLVIEKSLSLIGEDAWSTEINGAFLGSSLDTVNITGDHVVISGFCITDNRGYYYQAAVKVSGDYVILSDCVIQGNEWVGVSLASASFCQVRECEMYENLIALHLVESRNNTIENCVCHENADAITLFQASQDNQLRNCTCARNSFTGIHIQESSGNHIIGCVCENGYDGISMAYAPNTKMRNNTMRNNVANFGIGASSVSDFFCDIDTSNMINGKPLYYLIEQSNLFFDETMEIGFLGLVRCSNISVKNCEFSWNFEGMAIVGTSHCLIENCRFQNNDGHGLLCVSSWGNTVKNCTFRNGFFTGIYLYSSFYNIIEHCTSSDSSAGVRLEYSPYNTIQEQMVEQCRIGILFLFSHGNTLKANRMSHCGLKVDGYDLSDYLNEVDSSNTVNGKPVYYCINETNWTAPLDAGEVLLMNCTNCTVSHLTINHTSVAIELAYSSGNLISENILSSNTDAAIDLDCAENNNNIIKENIIRENSYGIDVDSSQGTIIQGNLLLDTGTGVSFDTSQGSIISGNTIQDCLYGMYFAGSPLNTLTENILLNSSGFGLYFLSSPQNVLRSNAMSNCSLMVYGNTLAEYLNDVDASNTVNRKPVYYHIDQIDTTVPKDAGEVILVNCRSCTIKDLTLDSGTVGITLAYCSGTRIRGNMITNQKITGIDLASGGNDNTMIQGNTIQGNRYGVDIEYCTGTTLKYNLLRSNDYGVFCYGADDLVMKRNTLVKNYVGIDAVQTTKSLLRFNNIFLNSFYGLSAETCTVDASWNWWGASTGPVIHENGNGDRLQAIRDGHITYQPWLRLPVLFAGIFRFFLINSHHQASGGQAFCIPEHSSFDPDNTPLQDPAIHRGTINGMLQDHMVPLKKNR
ncbi:MAG: right-handed parallel beta-helix repeat-containing protein [Candidatus Thermoplasmatota archaeon]|nr:right-handed parallel beta-helix repeat-containing protein [Candidatus Thermoplasmatota archaeon]